MRAARASATVNGAILDELTGVEQIAINGNGGTDSLDLQVDFTGTPLSMSNISYGGGDEADTVDLSHAVSDNWVFAQGGEGADSAILGFAFHAAAYQQILDGNGALIGARISHTVGGQQVVDEFTGFESFVVTDGTRTLPLLFDEAPVATPDQVVGREDTTLRIALASLVANDTDADNDPLAVSAVLNAVNGTVSIVNGNAVFTPAAGFAGVAGFDYTVHDGKGGQDTGHVTVDVRPDADPVKLQLAAGGPGNDIIVNERGGTGLGATVAPLANGGFGPYSWTSLENCRPGVRFRWPPGHRGLLRQSDSPITNHRAPRVVGMANGDFVVVWYSALEVVNNVITNAGHIRPSLSLRRDRGRRRIPGQHDDSRRSAAPGRGRNPKSGGTRSYQAELRCAKWSLASATMRTAMTAVPSSSSSTPAALIPAVGYDTRGRPIRGVMVSGRPRSSRWPPDLRAAVRCERRRAG